MPEKIDLLERVAKRARVIYKFFEENFPDYSDKEAMEAFSMWISSFSEKGARMKARDGKYRDFSVLPQEGIKRITGVSPFRLKKVHRHFLNSPKEVRDKFYKLQESLFGYPFFE